MITRNSTILVVFGISGDLSQRYILPAVGQIAKADMLPEQFHIVGVTRKNDVSKNDLLGKVGNSDFVFNHMEVYTMDTEVAEEYERLKKHIEELRVQMQGAQARPAEVIFYLSVPPNASMRIIELLGTSGLAAVRSNKLLLEKPFGTNLQSATKLVSHIDTYFLPEQVYRADHYVAKVAVQNIIAFRSGNSLFKRTWNNNFIERIEITASENIGIEGRANFYEQTGALRDMVQSHLMSLAAIVLMDLPKEGEFETVPKLRYEALKQLCLACDTDTIDSCVTRGQYQGYRDEVGNPTSTTETFVSIKLHSTDPRWTGVPIILSTGKALQEKRSEIKIIYKKDQEHESNELRLRIQPDPSIEFGMWTKKPSYEYELSSEELHFSFQEQFKELPQAYEQVLFSTIASDHRLFTSSDEVLQTWRILESILQVWITSTTDLKIYPQGTSIETIMK